MPRVVMDANIYFFVDATVHFRIEKSFLCLSTSKRLLEGSVKVFNDDRGHCFRSTRDRG